MKQLIIIALLGLGFFLGESKKFNQALSGDIQKQEQTKTNRMPKFAKLKRTRSAKFTNGRPYLHGKINQIPLKKNINLDSQRSDSEIQNNLDYQNKIQFKDFVGKRITQNKQKLIPQVVTLNKKIQKQQEIKDNIKTQTKSIHQNIVIQKKIGLNRFNKN